MTPDQKVTDAALPPVEKRVTVPQSAPDAFALFTRGIAEWWPLEGFSVKGKEAATVTLEGRLGGRLYETGKDGSEHSWAEVLEWDEPHRVVFNWHPGKGPEDGQELEVTFEPSSAGTDVGLQHRGWERLGQAALEARNVYDSGWIEVLSHYTAGARASQS
ncbi:MAG: SRPBCC domain-containing protein [Actinobacteria bacterium]|nr:SRPBCC domain-containing protein [Actinomycetota bacterium]